MSRYRNFIDYTPGDRDPDRSRINLQRVSSMVHHRNDPVKPLPKKRSKPKPVCKPLEEIFKERAPKEPEPLEVNLDEFAKKFKLENAAKAKKTKVYRLRDLVDSDDSDDSSPTKESSFPDPGTASPESSPKATAPNWVPIFSSGTNLSNFKIPKRSTSSVSALSASAKETACTDNSASKFSNESLKSEQLFNEQWEDQ